MGAWERAEPGTDPAAGAAGAPDKAEAGEARLDWKAKAQENYDLFLRARADYENLARRTQRDVSMLVRLGKRDVFLKLLDLADNLARAEAAWRQTLAGCACDGIDGQSLVGGVNMIARQLSSILAAEGVRPIDAVGCAFDPGLHECVATWTSPDVKAETVTDEVRRGYTFDGEVLRAAQVRVAQPTDGSSGA
jgi:molecular chaperone GrpE